jgi:TonB family protein
MTLSRICVKILDLVANPLAYSISSEVTMKRLLLSFAILLVRPAPVMAQVQGAWTYNSTKDEMTDEVRFFISNNSSPVYGDRGDLIIGMIAWRCSATNGREVFIIFDNYFGGNSDDQVLVETRFDSAQPDSAWWSLSANKQGAFMPSEYIPSFTNRVARSRRLLLRVTDPLDGEAITYSFSLLGFPAVYRRLEPNCTKDEARFSPGDSLKDFEGGIGTGIVPSSDQVFMESVVEERPEVLSGPALNYPDLLRQAGVQGRVLVQAIIDTTGRAEPQSVKIIQSPNPGFDQPAKNYVLRALFRPGRVHGRAVRVLLNLPIDFKVKR